MTPPSHHRAIVLTPPGAGAIGVIRVVGHNVVELVRDYFRPNAGPPLSACSLDRLRYGRFVDGGETIDDVVVSVSVLGGEQFVDICAHGGVRIMERILETLERAGAPLAAAEDSERVWPAGNQIDREALDALSRSKTSRAVRFLLWQRENLVRCLEDIAESAPSDPGGAGTQLTAMMRGYEAARTLIDGAVVALVGPPNSGKSTLFNRLLGRPAVVVSPTPGTTRDWVAEEVEIHGVPFTVVDTAGRRAATDPLERQAIRAGQSAAERAAVRLLVLDGSKPRAADGWDPMSETETRATTLVAVNKSDLQPAVDLGDFPMGSTGALVPTVAISAKTGYGIEELCAGLLGLVGFQHWDDQAPGLFSSRQRGMAMRVLDLLKTDPPAAQVAITQELIGPVSVTERTTRL